MTKPLPKITRTKLWVHPSVLADIEPKALRILCVTQVMSRSHSLSRCTGDASSVSITSKFSRLVKIKCLSRLRRCVEDLLSRGLLTGTLAEFQVSTYTDARGKQCKIVTCSNEIAVSGISDTALLVYARMYRIMQGGAKTLWATQDHIAELVGVSVRTLQRCLAQLLAQCLLANKGRRGYNTTVCYSIAGGAA